jgi:acyl carrier protein
MSTTQIIQETFLQLDLDFPADKDENLFEIGIDSLSLVRLVMALEKRFSLRLATKSFDRDHFSTLRKMESHIESLKKGQQ